MKPKTMILLVVAIGCGLAASVMTSRLIAERGDGPREKTVKVLFTKAKIKQFELLKEPEKLFVEKELPESSVPKKAVHSFEEVKDKRVTRPIPEDVYITTDDLVNKDLNAIADQLRPGSRAVAFRVNPETLAGGFVLPGSHVDVMYTLRRGEQTSTFTILQNMLVLAVDMNPNREEGKQAMLGNTVTMAVLPKEAQDLTLASQTGELRLMLRPLGEEKPVAIRSSTLEDLIKPQEPVETSTTDPSGTGTGNLANLVPTIPSVPPPPGEKEPEPEPQPTEPEIVRQPKKHTLTIVQGEQTTQTYYTKPGEFESVVVPPEPKKEPDKKSPTRPGPATNTDRPATEPSPAPRGPRG